MEPEIRLRPFQPGDEVAFRELNEAWITKYFAIEDADRLVLGDPAKNIIAPGGHVYMAFERDIPVGCCAFLFMEPGVLELAKMAVAERLRGRGIGRRILEYAIAQARQLGTKRLYLETNSRLSNAIHLYESVGFRHLATDRHNSPYARANVFMEMEIK